MSGSARIIGESMRERLERAITHGLLDTVILNGIDLARVKESAANLLDTCCARFGADRASYRVEVERKPGVAYPGTENEHPHAVTHIYVRELSAIDRLADLA